MHLSRVLLASAATLLSLSAAAFPVEDPPRSLREHRPVVLTVTFDKEESPSADDHSYFRPDDQDVSGFPKNDKPYHRSPCPCLNALANHGYLPRDGKNLTRQMLKKAVMDVFHVGETLGQTLIDPLPETLTLADLGIHNLIEHDASMMHDDAHWGHDPAFPNATLIQQLFARATPDGMLNAKIVSRWRREREAESAAINPEFDFPFRRQGSAYAEAAAFLVAMGDYDTESISLAEAESFLVQERIPDDFVRSETEISLTHALYVASKLKARSVFSWEMLSN